MTGWLTAAVISLLIAIAIDWKCRNTNSKKYNLPPGPKGVPILGTFPALLRAPAHIVFAGKLHLTNKLQISMPFEAIDPKKCQSFTKRKSFKFATIWLFGISNKFITG